MFTISSKRVVLGDGLKSPLRVAPACIEIEGDRIVAVREDVSDWSEARDDIVCPAFVNAHTHVVLNAVRGLAQDEDLRGNMVESLYFRLEQAMSPEDIRAFARMGAYECLLSGTALVWDHYYAGIELAKAFCDVGLCAVVGPTLQDMSGPGVASLDSQLEATLELRGWGHKGIWSALAPHATDTVSVALWRRVAEWAESHALPIHAHVAQSIDEVRRVNEHHGCSPIELLRRAGALDVSTAQWVHMIFASRGDLSLLDSERHTLGYCPFSQAQFAFPAFAMDWTRWFVATDCASSNDAMNVQRDLVLTSAMRAALTTGSNEYRSFRDQGDLELAERVESHRVNHFDSYQKLNDPGFLLTRVWGIPGALHPELKAGVVEVGALANLLVLDAGHPSFWPARDPLRTLAFGDTQAAISKMMVRGVWMNRSLSEDAYYREARAEASTRLANLLKSAELSGVADH